MNDASDLFAAVALGFVLVGWILFALVFLLHGKPPREKESKRDRRSIAGIAIQGAAFAIVWTIRRPLLTPLAASLARLGPMFQLLVAVFAGGLVAGSIWMIAAALRTLGRQWSLAARLVEGHALITEGPYRLVRHPIYSGMLGMFLATGLVLSHWLAFATALAVFLLGTLIRIRSEERLLSGAFGPAYAAYAARVPALIPNLRA